MLSFVNLEFRYDPYPLGVARPVVDQEVYRAMCESFPPVEMFEPILDVGSKLSLSEKWGRKAYRHYVRTHPLWREFYRYVKHRSFLDSINREMIAHGVDLGLEKRMPKGAKLLARLGREIARGRLPTAPLRLRARFEFSMLRANGGYVLPHTDAQKKLITLIISIIEDGKWQESYGGGTDINRPKDVRRNFNWVNDYLSFEEVDVIETIPFVPNQCIVFVKTFNSLHSVRPLAAPSDNMFRRTLTINIEEDV